MALIAIKTNPSGDFAKDLAYRQTDPSDKGVICVLWGGGIRGSVHTQVVTRLSVIGLFGICMLVSFIGSTARHSTAAIDRQGGVRHGVDSTVVERDEGVEPRQFFA